VSDFPEITTEQIVARLRMIVAEPDSICKTDLHYIEDAADELESKCDEIARLRAERDEAQRELRKAETESFNLRVEFGVIAKERDEARREVCRDEAYRPSPSPPCTANQVANRRGWDCFKAEFFVGDDDHAKMEADSNNRLFRTTDMK